MTQAVETQAESFVDRRQASGTTGTPRERRQFADSYDGLSPEARELSEAIDHYKMRHRRRFVTHEELLSVVKSLGYHR